MRKSVKPADEAHWAQLFAPEDEVLREIRRESEVAGRAGIQVSPLEGKLLQVLIKAARVEKVVEIGSLFGYSGIWIARALPAWGSLVCIEKDPAHAQLITQNLKKAKLSLKVSVLQGEANTLLPSLESQGPFDMVFIDANKSGYLDYLIWAENHVRPGGIIAADNTRLFGTQHLPAPPTGTPAKSWRVMRAFNERLAQSTRFTSILVPTHEGMTIAVKNF